MKQPITLERVIRKAGKIKIRTRWLVNELIDSISPSQELTCPICNFSDSTSKFKVYIANCIFAGGKLVRHECPNCGVIFGTQRMLNMSPERLGQEYIEHYSCYNEGDSTESELRTFYSLNPSFQGIYLNYGCGRWSKTIEQLRNQGYQVYGFEPFSASSDSEYIITDVEKLKQMKFDGLFSNDVIEHLRYPEEALKFMASLIKPEACMAHTTHCYKYDCEITRFHLFFFTGDSLKFICDRIGLVYEDTKHPTTKLFKFKAVSL